MDNHRGDGKEPLEGLANEFWGRYAPGRYLELPGRGTTFIRELPGPRPDSPVVILIHGWTATAAVNWAALMPELQEAGYRVIGIDQRGHGRGIRTDDFKLEDCAGDTVAVMDALGISQAIVGGYSMGGPIAMLTAHRHPDRVAGLVLGSTAYDLNPRLPILLPFALAATAIVHWPAQAFDWWNWVPSLASIPTARWLDELKGDDPRAIVEAGAQLHRFNAEKWLPGIDVPCSVVETTHDGLVPPRTQLRTAELLPDCRVFKVKAMHVTAPIGAGHWVPQMIRAFNSVQRRIEAREAWRQRRHPVQQPSCRAVCPRSRGGLAGH